jgi:hypothetical protein
MNKKGTVSMKMLLKQGRKGTWLFGLLALLALAACGTSPASNTGANNPVTPQKANSFSFNLVPSPNITKCLAQAKGSATIVPGDLNDLLTVSVSGLAPNTGYDLFVIQVPNKPFGVAWYQSDLETDGHGNGSVSVRGIFNVETFSISTGGTTTFPATHQYHLGLWFNDPQVPFKLGCEPGATAPVVTPFNGEQHAGIQVLNTSNFPDNAGPLSHVSA